VLTAATYLDELNPEQRRAVEHGVSQDGTVGPPLLVIAGAGSGKTNALAHRVAHLIVNGAERNVASQGPRIDIAARMRERWR
jgi:DNA helicase II / ATP-dependent DNA helicase PcrA